ncbi:MAG: hypothetical protein AB1671_20835, partial [Thermodesulfobacteriota bacterium]
EISNPAIQALLRDGRQFNLRHIQPGPFLGGVGGLELLRQREGLCGWEDGGDRAQRVGIKGILYQAEDLHLRVVAGEDVC